jgi:hypothetical protein
MENTLSTEAPTESGGNFAGSVEKRLELRKYGVFTRAFRFETVNRSFIEQTSTSHVLQGLQRTANILSTEAPTEIGGNL